MLTGSLAGALGGPVLISLRRSAARPASGWTRWAWSGSWCRPCCCPGMALVFLIRPDPREIATQPAPVLPGSCPSARRRPPTRRPAIGFRAWVGHYPLRVAFMAGFGAQGMMMLMMVMTSLALAHHGHDLPMISLSVALHTVGMYGLSLPIGRLTDRLGRRSVMMLGMRHHRRRRRVWSCC